MERDSIVIHCPGCWIRRRSRLGRWGSGSSTSTSRAKLAGEVRPHAIHMIGQYLLLLHRELHHLLHLRGSEHYTLEIAVLVELGANPAHGWSGLLGFVDRRLIHPRSLLRAEGHAA